jgi:hypothetical protein
MTTTQYHPKGFKSGDRVGELTDPNTSSAAKLISSASSTEGGEVFYGLTDWLGSCDPMTHYDYAPDSLFGLDD